MFNTFTSDSLLFAWSNNEERGELVLLHVWGRGQLVTEYIECKRTMGKTGRSWDDNFMMY